MLFAKNVVDYAIFAAPPPFFHNFRYLNFYDRKDLIVKKNKGFCYHLSSENSKSVHEETKNLSPGSSLYKWRLIKKIMTWEHRWYLYCSNLNSRLGNSSENFPFLIALLQTKRFYLTRDNSLIQGSLDWPFSELFITFNIFSCRIWIISCKTFVITVTSNETINELIIYAILCQNVTIFYRQKLTSLSQVQEKLTVCRQSK